MSESEPLARSRQPFRSFFALAALDAIAGVLLWLLPYDSPSVNGHREELLWGMVPAVMAGFLLTALPRWTHAPPIQAALVDALLLLWLAGRFAHWWWPDHGSLLAGAFILGLAATLGVRVVAAGKTREYKIVALLVLLALAAVLPSVAMDRLPAGFSHRLALASVLALVAIISGRIIPALTATWLCLHDKDPARRLPPLFELASAVALAAALGCWCLGLGVGTPASACAAILHSVRLLSWRPLDALDHPGLLALYLAYGWLPAGFALLFLHQAGLGPFGESAAIHAWAVGAIGLMCLAVMASMIRRQTRRPFSKSGTLTAALACGAAAVPSRLMVEVAGRTWLLPAVACWIGAFLLFLLAFRAELLWPLGPIAKPADRPRVEARPPG
ncbi:uncharacterized protein involved in response to NO [Bosea sp. CRIB-10]|uniref:NnrS family protein n=1 Tax=Bosea sp. CRIB-10 TaxID=378404 RepID=UPI0008E7B7C0|nr:NnrS family protein [Bosea sp. CRIB-10]SFC86149.1 uncharacterized protein involved in response to NO [Bosea sp. CRIB-10]